MPIEHLLNKCIKDTQLRASRYTLLLHSKIKHLQSPSLIFIQFYTIQCVHIRYHKLLKFNIKLCLVLIGKNVE